MEQYNFSPATLFEQITPEEYLTYLKYSLEYRALVMEQLSHEREQAYLAAHPDPNTREDGYGVVLLNCWIRDLKGTTCLWLKRLVPNYLL
jgi:hypothetical protein